MLNKSLLLLLLLLLLWLSQSSGAATKGINWDIELVHPWLPALGELQEIGWV